MKFGKYCIHADADGETFIRSDQIAMSRDIGDCSSAYLQMNPDVMRICGPSGEFVELSVGDLALVQDAMEQVKENRARLDAG